MPLLKSRIGRFQYSIFSSSFVGRCQSLKPFKNKSAQAVLASCQSIIPKSFFAAIMPCPFCSKIIIPPSFRTSSSCSFSYCHCLMIHHIFFYHHHYIRFSDQLYNQQLCSILLYSSKSYSVLFPYLDHMSPLLLIRLCYSTLCKGHLFLHCHIVR